MLSGLELLLDAPAAKGALVEVVAPGDAEARLHRTLAAPPKPVVVPLHFEAQQPASDPRARAKVLDDRVVVPQAEREHPLRHRAGGG